MMKRLFWLILFFSGMAWAQGVRYDSVAFNPRGAPIPNATITLCTGTATGTPCSPAALGYTDGTAGVTCASGFPVVQQIGGGCTSTTDGNGNFGFWLVPGIYKYSISGPSVATPQTYTITIPAVATSPTVLTVVADRFAGADCGAKINAASAFLAANSPAGGVIQDFPANCGAVTTPVFMGSNQYLIQYAGTQNWGSNAAPVGSGNGSLNFISIQNAGFTCQPGCIMLNTQTGYTGSDNSRDLIFADSGNPICSTTLNANANEGTTTLTTVATPTGCAIGQDINIEDTRFSEVNRICNVVGSTITLCGPLENSYTTARTAGINVYNWAKNIFIDGVNIQGNNGSGSGIYMQSVLDFKVSNLNVKGISGRCFLAGRFSSRGFFTGANCDGYSTSLTGVPGAEYYIWTQHLNATNITIHDYASHGWVLHGFHKQISGFNLYRNGLSGLSCDSGAKIEISNGNSNSNLANGFNIGGGALNTVECTEVTMTNVTATDNLGDGLHAGDGGNVTLNVTGSQFLRNQGTNGGAYYNAVQPGSTFSNNTVYGNTNNGFVIDGSTTGLEANFNNFKFPANSAANGGNDIKIAATGSLASSNIQWPLYGAGTPFNNAGTFDCTSINYMAGTGSQQNCIQNNGQTTTYNGGHEGGLNAINYADNASPLFCAATQTSTGADTTDAFWKYCFNNAAEQHVPQAFVLHSAYTNATTSFTTISDGTRSMSFTAAANKDYKITCDFVYQASASTAGPKIQITGPSTPTYVVYDLWAMTSATQAAGAPSDAATHGTAFSTSLTSGTAIGSTATDLTMRVTGTIANGANAGAVAVQAAANGVGTLTIEGGGCQFQ